MTNLQESTASVRFELPAGVVAGPLFAVVFTVAGLHRPDYRALRYPISSLSIGPEGWIQAANFIIAAVLLLICANGLRSTRRFDASSRWIWRLVALSGIGLAGAGLFTTDPLFGYPSDQPLRLVQFTLTGRLHDLWSMMFFIGLPAAALVDATGSYKRRDYGWTVYCVGTAAAAAVLFVLTSVGFQQITPFRDIAGLLQRATILVAMAWLAAKALMMRRLAQQCWRR
jgi:hypothetical membrane protein